MVTTVLQGGLCNNLFQISCCLSYAKKWGMDYFIPTTVINPHHKGSPTYLFPNINYSDRELNLPIYIEPGFTYTEIPYMKNVCLSGYFQSYRYIEPYRDEIIKAFGFDNLVTIPNICSLHYRAGDFKNLPTIHPIVSKEYLIAAINQMISKGYKRFLVFSDDIPEIKKIIEGFNWYNDCIFEYSEGKSDLEDLKLMASCESNVISNSTFGWWSAYVNPNPNKIVIYPQKWFGDALPHDTKDLCPKKWIAL